MSPLQAIPPRFRATAYLIYGIGSIVVAYLAGRGTIGNDELTAWAGVGVLFGFGAASNTNIARHPQDDL